jgi:endonuclease YncB( thermonuclease family)
MRHLRASLVVAGLASTLLAAFGGVTLAHAQAAIGPAYVTRVVDADTLYAEIGGHLEVVRYLGINTPRIEHPTYGRGPYATAAREANRRLVEGRWVNLVFDGSTRDRLGRLVAYVWVGNVFVNATLAHYGYVETATGSTAVYVPYFRELEEGAVRDRRGLWRDPEAVTYHRPRPTELAADESDDPLGTVVGGRVFSAPAPFIPAPSSSSSGGAISSGSPSFVAPRGSLRTMP